MNYSIQKRDRSAKEEDASAQPENFAERLLVNGDKLVYGSIFVIIAGVLGETAIVTTLDAVLHENPVLRIISLWIIFLFFVAGIIVFNACCHRRRQALVQAVRHLRTSNKSDSSTSSSSDTDDDDVRRGHPAHPVMLTRHVFTDRKGATKDSGQTRRHTQTRFCTQEAQIEQQICASFYS